MKTFVLIAVATLIVGGIYRTEVSQYFADLTEGSSKSGGAAPVVESMRGMGNASNALMGRVGDALDR